MGRAMLIICAGVLLSLGYITASTSDTGQSLVFQTSEYAKKTHALNAAHTAIQIAFKKMNDDENWAKNHQGESNAWTSTIENASTTLYLSKYVEGTSFFDTDSMRIVSKARFLDTEKQVVSLYLKQPFSEFVPDFEGPLTIPTDNFTINAGGSASISGNAPSGSGCEDKPAVTVTNSTDSASVQSDLNNIDVEGSNPLIKTNPNLTYQPTDELIARLKNSGNAKTITGNYKGEMGTQDNPGVFFVEDNAKLTGGISEGYGILVVRTAGELAYEGEDGAELDIAGNFTFNGLVVFENAYNFNGRGTPTINGSVLVGNTEDYTGTIDIDISGNIHLQYDCVGEEYAKQAAAEAVQQQQFRRVTTYE